MGFQKRLKNYKEDENKRLKKGASNENKREPVQLNFGEQKKSEEDFNRLKHELAELEKELEAKTKDYYLNEIKNMTIQNLISKEKERYNHYANYNNLGGGEQNKTTEKSVSKEIEQIQ